MVLALVGSVSAARVNYERRLRNMDQRNGAASLARPLPKGSYRTATDGEIEARRPRSSGAALTSSTAGWTCEVPARLRRRASSAESSRPTSGSSRTRGPSRTSSARDRAEVGAHLTMTRRGPSQGAHLTRDDRLGVAGDRDVADRERTAQARAPDADLLRVEPAAAHGLLSYPGAGIWRPDAEILGRDRTGLADHPAARGRRSPRRGQREPDTRSGAATKGAGMARRRGRGR